MHACQRRHGGQECSGAGGTECPAGTFLLRFLISNGEGGIVHFGIFMYREQPTNTHTELYSTQQAACWNNAPPPLPPPPTPIGQVQPTGDILLA